MKSLNYFGRRNFSVLKQKLVELIPKKQAELQELRKRIGGQSLGSYNVDQVIGGMRGMKGLFQDISSVDPFSGVMMRGYTIPQLKEFLPNAVAQGEPLPEGLFWLLMTGELPTNAEFKSIHDEWNERGKLKDETVNFILSLPRDTHPMTMLSMAVLFEQKNSKFNVVYSQGKANKKNNWEYYLEDSLDLTAKVPKLAAVIYRHKYHRGDIICSDPTLDWAADYAHMLGFSGESIQECLRGYLSIHADHEGGNVSAHATHLVGSALADPYLSFSAGLNGLAGPLHGLANQEVLKWILNFINDNGGDPANIKDQQIIDYVRKVIEGGNVVPGYGHAVLRETDPRFTHQYEFSKKHIPNEPMIKLLHDCSDIIPHTLKQFPKIKNPYPNVDCHSGVLLYSLGLKEYEYYTVVFAVSRALGCTTWLVWDRIYNMPIQRPGSVDIAWLNHKFRD